MFFGNNDQSEKQKGKRTSGFQARKQGEFSLGWNVTQQKNEFQVRREQKEQSMAGKVTEQRVSQSQQQGQRSSASTIQEKCRELIEQYPDITTQELHERLALWELNNKQQIGRPAQQKTESKPAQKVDGRQAPIKPTQSAKNAIYGGSNDQNFNKTHGKASKRNEGSFSLGDYNYFKDENNNRR